eukprot:TRINITY_DN2652_c1_g2_i1.p1 TRINITY_DN2652_c1_g2~~TRINITY_DN2652_c1_g2_i1.p1  ORF type:complete len:627 (+),score=159.62 TRINITY_DN2652_c1_g2_i1:1-1881(+)
MLVMAAPAPAPAPAPPRAPPTTPYVMGEEDDKSKRSHPLAASAPPTRSLARASMGAWGKATGGLDISSTAISRNPNRNSLMGVARTASPSEPPPRIEPLADGPPVGGGEAEAPAQTKQEKKEAYRRNVVKEILTTEREYVSDLDTLVQVFLHPLRARQILTAVELNNLFSNVEILANLNRKVMEEFEESEREQGDVLLVGPIFLKMADFLKMYTTYCANQPVSIKSLETLTENNTQFAAFLQECLNDEQCRGLTLFSFLIKPIQRICKYPLLLRDLIKNTAETHPDWDNLQQAFEKIETVVDYVNERKRLAENLQRTMDIQTNIVEDVHILSPSRRFAREAEIMVNEGGKLKDRRLYLFNDLIILVKGIGRGPKEHLKEMVSMGDLRVVDVADTDDLQHAFELCNKSTAATKFSHVVKFPSVEDKNSWLKEIKQSVKEFQRKEALEKKEAIEKGEDPFAPPPDSPRTAKRKEKEMEKEKQKAERAAKEKEKEREKELAKTINKPGGRRPYSTRGMPSGRASPGTSHRPVSEYGGMPMPMPGMGSPGMKARPPGTRPMSARPSSSSSSSDDSVTRSPGSKKKEKKGGQSLFGLKRSDPGIVETASVKPSSAAFKKKLNSSLKKGPDG